MPSATRTSIVSSASVSLVEPARRLVLGRRRARRRGSRSPGQAVSVAGSSPAPTRARAGARRRPAAAAPRASAGPGRSPRPRGRRLAPGSARRPAAAPRQSRTARIRIAWSGSGFSSLAASGARSVAVAGGGPPLVVVRQRVLGGVDRHLGVFDLAEAVDQALPLVRFQQRRELGFAGRLRAGGSRRGRGRSGRPSRSWSGRAGPRARSPGGGASSPAAAARSAISSSVTVPGPWLPVTGAPLITAMSTASPVVCSETLPEVVRRPWPHCSEVIVRS